jgi:hypothetical protein
VPLKSKPIIKGFCYCFFHQNFSSACSCIPKVLTAHSLAHQIFGQEIVSKALRYSVKFLVHRSPFFLSSPDSKIQLQGHGIQKQVQRCARRCARETIGELGWGFINGMSLGMCPPRAQMWTPPTFLYTPCFHDPIASHVNTASFCSFPLSWRAVCGSPFS